MIDGLPKTNYHNKPCEGCLLGKQTRRSFITNTNIVNTGKHIFSNMMDELLKTNYHNQSCKGYLLDKQTRRNLITDTNIVKAGKHIFKTSIPLYYEHTILKQTNVHTLCHS